MMFCTTLISAVIAGLGSQGWDAKAVDEAISRHGHSSLSPTDQFRSTVRLDRETRKVEVRWKYSASSSFGDPPDLSLQQEFAVPYIPTTAEFLHPDQILVAGTLGTTTMVELWGLRHPLLELTVPGGGGAPQQTLVAQSREFVQLVYRKDPSPGIVETLIWNRGKPRTAFLRFTDSDDLYELRWPLATGLGSATVLVSAAQDPGLSASDYDAAFRGDHVVQGYVYYLEVHQQLDRHAAYVLLDNDRDGVIDFKGLWGYDDFDRSGLTQIGQWLDYAGQAPPL